MAISENSKQFISGLVVGLAGYGILLWYIWNSTIDRLGRCEKKGDDTSKACQELRGEIDALNRVCDERHKK